jgi:hypothetical protein
MGLKSYVGRYEPAKKLGACRELYSAYSIRVAAALASLKAT